MKKILTVFLACILLAGNVGSYADIYVEPDYQEIEIISSEFDTDTQGHNNHVDKYSMDTVEGGISIEDPLELDDLDQQGLELTIELEDQLGTEDTPITQEMTTNAGDSFSSATSISFNTIVDGAITETNSSDFYVFTISTSGRVVFSATAYMKYIYYRLYDASGTELWYDNPQWNTTTGKSVISPGLDLIGGTYYLAVEKDGSSGNYSFNLSFESANESFDEYTGRMNNSMETADTITFNTNVYGQLAINDSEDFYKVILPSSGRAVFSATAYMKYVYYRLYDASGTELWYDNPQWSTTTGKSVISPELDLIGGTYYLAVVKDGSSGNYSFTLSFESANESFDEYSGRMNNSMETADTVTFNTNIYGQLAINDSEDFYKIILPSSGRVVFSATAYMKYIYYRLYDVSGTELWYDNPQWNTTTGKSVINSELDLIGGTYYLAVVKDGSSGNYSFNLLFESANESFDETLSNNDIEGANTIQIGNKYSGQLAINDEKDFYAFSLSTDTKLSITISAPCDYIYVSLYDNAATQLWEKNLNCNSTTKKIESTIDVNLSASTYYLCIHKDGNITTPYTICVSTEDTPTTEPTTTPTVAPEIVMISDCKITVKDLTYTGKKIKKPTVTVKAGSVKLKEGTDYSISYDKNVKAIGAYKLTVKGKGMYSGSKKVTFKVIPKGVTLSKLTTGSKKLTVKWKKGTGITGYEVQYSLKSDFSSAKKVTISKAGTIKTVLKGLTPNKTYYVRIRTYKTVGKKKYYSAWSKAKSAKPKK